MNDYPRKSNSDCKPAENPAPQPTPPKEGEVCAELPATVVPKVEKPVCTTKNPNCSCPTPPGSTSDCLETLITEQSVAIDASEKASKFKKELEDLLAKAKAARAAYTQTAYEDLVDEWVRQDIQIAKLINSLVCKLNCWDCILECHVCPLLDELHIAEKWLRDDMNKPYADADVRNLYDKRYWLSRDKEAKKRTFGRISGILAAWEKPAETLKKTLDDNQKLYEKAFKAMETSPTAAIFDVFLRLVPTHLAIAPPKGDETLTKIDAKYTDFCKCGDHKPEYCCGVNVGERSFRDRLIGPLPYLLDPGTYFDLICCLVKNRYVKAQEALSKAESDLLEIETTIANLEKQIGAGWQKDFETAATGAIPSAIDCCEYEPDPPAKPPTTQTETGETTPTETDKGNYTETA